MEKNKAEGAGLEALVEITDGAEVKVAIRRLEIAMAQLRTTMVEGFEHAQVQLDTLRDELTEKFEDLSLNQRSLTAAVVEAVTQLNLSRTYDKRLQRLEEKVFGSSGT